MTEDINWWQATHGVKHKYIYARRHRGLYDGFGNKYCMDCGYTIRYDDWVHGREVYPDECPGKKIVKTWWEFWK